ncbi:unnamed protein product, partial [Owenia fusiformis]
VLSNGIDAPLNVPNDESWKYDSKEDQNVVKDYQHDEALHLDERFRIRYAISVMSFAADVKVHLQENTEVSMERIMEKIFSISYRGHEGGRLGDALRKLQDVGPIRQGGLIVLITPITKEKISVLSRLKNVVNLPHHILTVAIKTPISDDTLHDWLDEDEKTVLVPSYRDLKGFEAYTSGFICHELRNLQDA